jgi:ATP-dependent Clp protease ATP-binding subunit ClpA
MFERYSDRARQVIVIALWSAWRRGGSHIEPEDLLHALIREDRGEFTALSTEVFPGAPSRIESPAAGHRPFFADEVAKTLLQELGEEPDRQTRDTPSGRLEPVPHVDMPVSESLKQVLASVARITRKRDSKRIEPLHLLAGIVEDREGKLAQLLLDHRVTRQKVAQALDAAHNLQ